MSIAAKELEENLRRCWICVDCFESVRPEESFRGKTTVPQAVSHRERCCCFCTKVTTESCVLVWDGMNNPSMEYRGLITRLIHVEFHTQHRGLNIRVPGDAPELEALHDLMKALDITVYT